MKEDDKFVLKEHMKVFVHPFRRLKQVILKLSSIPTNTICKILVSKCVCL